MIPWEWEGAEDQGETWKLEIQHDRMDADMPLVVTLFASNTFEGTKRDTLVCATPDQAREMAKALNTYAAMADKQNA